MSDPKQVRRTDGNRRSLVLAIGAATALALALIWLIAVPIGPEACALSLPGPRNCFVSDRIEAAIVPTVVILAVALLSITLALVGRRTSRRSAIISLILIVVLAAGSYVLVAWIPALAWWWRPGVEL